MKNYRHSRKPLLPKLALVGIVVVIIVAGVLIYQWQQYNYFISTPVNSHSTDDIILTIKKGENSKTIADNLSSKLLILNEDSFKWYTRLNNLDTQFKTGRFTLNQSLTIPEITKILSSNDQRQVVVTIPEGSTVEDIDRIVADAGLSPAGEFAKAVQGFQNYNKYSFLNQAEQSKLVYPLEGYLFPDTYFVSAANYSNDLLISQLLNTFKSKVMPELTGSARSVDQIVNVAAMVEKEANRDVDRPIVAGIIWKRLDSKWALGIDATLLYLKKDRQLTYDDLQEDHGYNTRTRQGLPEGPIANPGLASLNAAAHPAETPYFYYLTSRNGDMVYATTNSEHNANKAKYL